MILKLNFWKNPKTPSADSSAKVKHKGQRGQLLHKGHTNRQSVLITALDNRPCYPITIVIVSKRHHLQTEK